MDYLKNRLAGKPKFNAYEEDFFASVLGLSSTVKEKYEILRELAETLLKGSPFANEQEKANGNEVPNFAVERASLQELVERKVNALIRQDYSVDWGRAVPLMVSRIRDWGAEINYHGPKTWQGTTIIVSEVKLGDEARMKFQIGVGNEGNLRIGFFDNDSKRVLSRYYPQLGELFNALFGTDGQLDDDFGLWRTVDAPPCESALDDFLHENAGRFMKCFVVEMEKWQQYRRDNL